MTPEELAKAHQVIRVAIFYAPDSENVLHHLNKLCDEIEKLGKLLVDPVINQIPKLIKDSSDQINESRRKALKDAIEIIQNVDWKENPNSSIATSMIMEIEKEIEGTTNGGA